MLILNDLQSFTQIKIRSLAELDDRAIERAELEDPVRMRIWKAAHPEQAQTPRWFCDLSSRHRCRDCGHENDRAPFARGYGLTPAEAFDRALEEVRVRSGL